MKLMPGAAGGSTTLRGETFTGEVWGTPVLAEPDVTVNLVSFLPGARTFWHFHERGQILVMTSGTGLVCVEGSEPVPVRHGDVVWIEPGERHWHGADSNSTLVHLAITLGDTTWLNEVDN